MLLVLRVWMQAKVCMRPHKAQRGNRNLSDWKEDEASKWVEERGVCVWCCQQCLPVGSHFLHRSRAGLQPFRPSRNSPHNLSFIGGQSDAGSWQWLRCTDACVSVCWRELLSPQPFRWLPECLWLSLCVCCVTTAMFTPPPPNPVGRRLGWALVAYWPVRD